MRLLVDTHTHTVVSGHAFSTLLENLDFAAKRGLEGIVTSEHSEKVPGVQPNFTIRIQNCFPKEYNGVRIIKGAEVNIMDYSGQVDMKREHLMVPDFVIASLHDVTISSGTKMENTQAMIGALQNPYIDIIGHPGNPQFEIDREAVVQEARRQNKLLEINNHSFAFRKGSPSICREIIRLCKKHGVRISVGSDAHVCFRVGYFGEAVEALTDEGFPEELIVSRSMQTFDEYLAERKRRTGSA